MLRPELSPMQGPMLLRRHLAAPAADRRNLAARITAAGFNSSAAGENIATGFATPHDVVKAWMASTGHCRNILAPTFAGG